MIRGAPASSVGTEMVRAPSGPYKPPQTLAGTDGPSYDWRGYAAAVTSVKRDTLIGRVAVGRTSCESLFGRVAIDSEDCLIDRRSEARTFPECEFELSELGVVRIEGNSRLSPETNRNRIPRGQEIEALQAEIRALQHLLPEGESRPSSTAIERAFSIASVWPEVLDVPVVGSDEGCILFDVFEPSGLVVAEVEVDRSGTQAVWAVVSPLQEVSTGTIDLTLPAAGHRLSKTLSRKYNETRD